MLTFICCLRSLSRPRPSSSSSLLQSLVTVRSLNQPSVSSATSDNLLLPFWKRGGETVANLAKHHKQVINVDLSACDYHPALHQTINVQNYRKLRHPTLKYSGKFSLVKFSLSGALKEYFLGLRCMP